MATYGPIVCTNPTVVFFSSIFASLSHSPSLSLSLSPFYNNAHRWQIYAQQLWVLSSQLTTLDDYHSPPSPSALYLAVFTVCKLLAPKADPVFLLSYLAGSEVQHCTGSHPYCFAKGPTVCVAQHPLTTSHSCVPRWRRQLCSRLYETVSFIKCERVCVTLRRISLPGQHRQRVESGNVLRLQWGAATCYQAHGLKQTACWEMSRWFWVSTEISEDLKS